MNSKLEKVDVLVIGAGPAGTVAASVMKQNGLSVKIVEKQRFPRFVIGESLLPRCMDNLKYAGLLDAVEKAGFQKKFGAKFVKEGKTCDFEFFEQFTEGWNWTWQVQRADFDQILARETEKKGVAIEFETEVVGVDFFSDGSSETTVKTKEGTTEKIAAKRIVDASGYGRVLPGLLHLNAPSDFPIRASFFCHLEETDRPAGPDGSRITVVLHGEEVWIWIIPFANDTTSVGFVGLPETINRFKGSAEEQYQQWLELVPELKERFLNSKKLFEPQKIIGYSAAVKQLYGHGYVLTGNSTEFLDPVFSSGVTLATESGVLAAKLLCRELAGEQVDWEKDYSDYIRKGVNVFRTFVSSWYEGTLPKIFFHHQSNHEMKRQICSILAGYVWDEKNPFVRKHERALKALASLI